jgi:hypothetical protein
MKTFRFLLATALAILSAALLLVFSAIAAEPAQNISISLTKPATPTKASSPAGFIQRWLVLEPIHANGVTEKIVQDTMKTEFFPGQLTIIPHDGESVNCGGTNLVWHALDTERYNFDLYQFAHAFNKPSSDVLFWAVTIIDSPQEIPNARLAIGSNAASVWWINGQEVISIYGDRQTVIDDGVSKRLTLKKGPNLIRCAIINGGGATDFCARILDSNDKPVGNLTINLTASAL